MYIIYIATYVNSYLVRECFPTKIFTQEIAALTCPFVASYPGSFFSRGKNKGYFFPI